MVVFECQLVSNLLSGVAASPQDFRTSSAEGLQHHLGNHLWVNSIYLKQCWRFLSFSTTTTLKMGGIPACGPTPPILQYLKYLTNPLIRGSVSQENPCIISLGH